MKRLVSTVLLHFVVLTAVAQIGNEWIQYHQPYVRIPVGQDGVHRITYDDLQQAGFPVAADPAKFQLFHRGVQQAIRIEGEDDGVFHTSDYVEFYGRKNDGALDSTLYETPSYQPHRYYNLYSDTTAYFLTVGSENGKRMTVYTEPSNGLTPESFHWGEQILLLKESYSSGLDYGNVHKTVFDAGEGWMSAQILHGQEKAYSIAGITDPSSTTGKPLLHVLLTGRGPMVHEVEISTASRLLAALSFNAYQSYLYTQELEWSDIDATGTLEVKVRVTGSAGPDRVSVGYIRVLFPQRVTMSAVTTRMFIVEAKPDMSSFLKVESPPADVRLFDVTDPSAVIQLHAILNSTLDVVVPPSPVRRNILATSTVIAAAGVSRVSFRPLNPAEHDYIVITHHSLRTPALGYVDPVMAYAEYRSLPEGGGFDTLVVNIDQLYNQFNYGETSPRAIFQFVKFLATGKLPQYMFLIGKGLNVSYGYHRNPGAFSSYKDLVPTAGYPASDMAFSAGSGGVDGVAAIATGRLSAISPSEVAAYLNKVKERDALPFNDLNRKKILHLSGGIEEHEPPLFRNILQEFETIAEDKYLGGSVQAIAKQSTDIKLINIAEVVNEGVGLITFFGHSAPNTLDFDIGRVTDPVMGYDNAGKYPFLLMNGCDAGSFFLNTAIMGENWILTPEKGAVGFIAHSSYGLVSALQKYSSTFYEVAFADSVYLRRGVGMVQQEVGRRCLDKWGASALFLSQIQQMVLLGDPALKVFGAAKPDYAINTGEISISSFDDEPVTALSDSFRIDIPIRNTGIAGEKNIRIGIIRELSNERTIEYDSIIPAVLYADTIGIIVRNDDQSGFGINIFRITVEADDIVAELDESNNTAVFEYFIPLNSTRNLYPYNYSIVNSQDLSLSFQYTDLLAATRDYVLEIDTAKSFDSGYKQQFIVSGKVLGRMSVTLLDTDSLAYYWRTRIADPLEHDSKTWSLSSFTYIHQGPEGWAQAHFPQFESNQSIGLVKDAQVRRLKFQETVSDVAVRTFSTAAGQPQDSVHFKINGVEFNIMSEGGACRNNTINLTAFDRSSTQPYAGIYFKWYEILYDYGGRRLLCGREPYVINSFEPDELVTGNGDDLIQYVDNIAAGDSVVLFNIGDAGYEQWPDAAKEKLSSFGISTAQLSPLRNGDAAVIFGRKGAAPGTATVYHAVTPETLVKVDRTITGRFTSGTMSSGMIGPARHWQQLVCKVSEVEAPDHFGFTVVGIRVDGEQDTLKTALLSGADLSLIDAGTYPYIKIIFETADEIDLTSVQLSKWMVVYEPVAEGLIGYSNHVSPLVVAEGEEVTQSFTFTNISNKTFEDSLTVRYELRNQGGNNSGPSTIRIPAPLPGDTTNFSLRLQTVSRTGINDVEVFVNPRILYEQSYDNNVIRLSSYVEVLKDNSDPVIDVTFDGRHIANDEFVSQSPSIHISVWDENLFLQKTDTLATRIYLASGCDSGECEYQPVYFSRPDITWQAAAGTSEFDIVFSPRDLPSGSYSLRVESADASGNFADGPFEIRFRVEVANTVSVSPAYPNPFFTDTNIEVVVTGATSVYSSYKFLITTIDGRVVAAYASGEGLHVGRNVVRWNGHGVDGRTLANGLYFYRLVLAGDGGEKQYTGKVVLRR